MNDRDLVAKVNELKNVQNNISELTKRKSEVPPRPTMENDLLDTVEQVINDLLIGVFKGELDPKYILDNIAIDLALTTEEFWEKLSTFFIDTKNYVREIISIDEEMNLLELKERELKGELGIK